MSWSWTIPSAPEPGLGLAVPGLSMENTRVIVPTFGDWDEAHATIDSVLRCHPRPAEVVVVNDNSDLRVPDWLRTLPIRVVDYPGNRGPAYARNAGAGLETGRRIDWYYFTDTGCERPEGFFQDLQVAHRESPCGVVAHAGPVTGTTPLSRAGPINRYMTIEEILSPPRDRFGPQAIVTANALVSAAGFRSVGGFDVIYPFAAGEDIDLGLKLRRLGPIGWMPDMIVEHRFQESVEDFRRRFLRYGAGTAHLEAAWSLASLRPVRFSAHDERLQYLADLQVTAMQYGYDRHLDAVRMSIT
jgi:GT2 family glycosyltransferase